MKTKLLLLLTSALLYTSISCEKQTNDNLAAPEGLSGDTTLTEKQINTAIENELVNTGTFNWNNAGLPIIWSALQHSDHMMCVGYKPVTEGNIDNKIARININAPEWKDARQKVMDIILRSERKLKPGLTAEQIEVWKEYKLPVIDVEIHNIETVKLLLNSRLVRYAEPMGYDPIAEMDMAGKETGTIGFDGSGCGGYVGNPA